VYGSTISIAISMCMSNKAAAPRVRMFFCSISDPRFFSFLRQPLSSLKLACRGVNTWLIVCVLAIMYLVTRGLGLQKRSNGSMMVVQSPRIAICREGSASFPCSGGFEKRLEKALNNNQFSQTCIHSQRTIFQKW